MKKRSRKSTDAFLNSVEFNFGRQSPKCSTALARICVSQLEPVYQKQKLIENKGSLTVSIKASGFLCKEGSRGRLGRT
jgi:hypothetical protein